MSKAGKIIHMFPDTNLFIQCRVLEELDWSRWVECGEIQLIVSRPVQREIDIQKNKGSERLGRRARKASALFRNVILSDERQKIIRDSDPRVILLVKPEYQHSQSLRNTLNYNEPDDQLVGTVHAFAKNDADADVRLLTHDTGPMATAQMVGVPIEAIPNDWLLPPENSATEKAIIKLQSELERLKSAEPDIVIQCMSRNKQEVKEIKCEFLRYERLTNDELSGLIARIRDSHPPETDFGPRQTKERRMKTFGLDLTGMKEVYTPATKEEIAAYCEEKYPAWLEQCESILKHYHINLAQDISLPSFAFAATNNGTRPAKDVLITISAHGNFRIRPRPKREEPDSDERKADQINNETELPMPPDPPKGTWEPKAMYDITSSLQGIKALLPIIEPRLDQTYAVGRNFSIIPHLIDPESRRDPNAFYWKDGRPHVSVPSFRLICDRWRHGTGPEYFEGEIFFEWKEKRVSGELECQIHAENLSEIELKKIPVRIRVKHRSALDRATLLVDTLCSEEPK